ncbi:MAG: hypothetical protein HPY50_04900 [Firmicutes bacterium]|nr:hypothetical protein [Bacillota bacterium]
MALPKTTDGFFPAIGGKAYLGEADTENQVTVASGNYFKSNNLWVPVSNSNPMPILGCGSTVSASFTRPSNTTAYDAGDVVGQNPGANMVFENVLSNPGGTFMIMGARLSIPVAAVPSGMSTFRLHLYNSASTAIADNTAYNLPAVDRVNYLGFITLSTPIDLGETLWSQDDNIRFTGKLAASSTTLYGILQTVSGFTPTSATVKTITLNVAGV